MGTDPEAPAEGDAATLPLGVLGRPHGLKGELTFHAFGEGPCALDELETPFVVTLRGRGVLREATVIGYRVTGQGRLLLLEGVESRDAAAALTNVEVEVARDLLPPLDEHEFYVEDLVGCDVQDAAGKALGTARGTFWNGAHDVLTVVTQEGAELMVPVVPEYILDVDLDANVVQIVVPELEEAGRAEAGDVGEEPGA